jgi:hypothetical protein
VYMLALVRFHLELLIVRERFDCHREIRSRVAGALIIFGSVPDPDPAFLKKGLDPHPDPGSILRLRIQRLRCHLKLH